MTGWPAPEAPGLHGLSRTRRDADDLVFPHFFRSRFGVDWISVAARAERSKENHMAGKDKGTKETKKAPAKSPKEKKKAKDAKKK